MMTLKDYELVVSALRRARSTLAGHSAAIAGVDTAAYELSQAFAGDDRRFDGARFFNAYDKED